MLGFVRNNESVKYDEQNSPYHYRDVRYVYGRWLADQLKTFVKAQDRQKNILFSGGYENFELIRVKITICTAI